MLIGSGRTGDERAWKEVSLFDNTFSLYNRGLTFRPSG